MGSEWEVRSLGELCLAITDGAHQSPKSVDVGMPMASVKDLTPFGVNIAGARKISQEDFVILEKQGCKPQIGDVLIAKDGNSALDTVCTVKEEANYVLLSSVAILRPNTSYLDPDFLKYYFCSEQTLDYLKSNFISGAAIPRVVLRDFKKAEVFVPPLSEQKAIVDILGSLDDKIELNQKMNQTFEAMAQALFKSWFVDFDPVIDNALVAGNPIPDEYAERAEIRKQALANGTANREVAKDFPAGFRLTEEMGWVPEGWEVAILGDYLEIKRGGSPRPIQDYLCDDGLPWVKIADATASTSRFLFATKECIKPEGLKKTVLKKKGSLILSNSATPGLPIFLELDACIHDGWLHFPNKKYFSDLYLYQLFLIIREELVGRGNGSVFTNLKTDILRAQKIVVPHALSLDLFNNWMRVNLDRLLKLNLEISSLSTIRDSILPFLLSGEIDVGPAFKIFKEGNRKLA